MTKKRKGRRAQKVLIVKELQKILRALPRSAISAASLLLSAIKHTGSYPRILNNEMRSVCLRRPGQSP